MKKNGFTLIEMIAVIIILGIIMLIAIPAVTEYILKSDRATYATDVIAYLETARADYEMKEYGELLKDDEIMILPIKYINLEKGDKESPFGEFDLSKSYITISPLKRGYQFYANVVDDHGYGVVMKTQTELDRDAVEENVTSKIISWESYNNPETTLTLNGKEYSMCETRDIVTSTQEYKDAVIILCSDREDIPNGINTSPEINNIYAITLDNQNATTEGTKTIYEKYNIGWYSNSSATIPISKITKPAKNGYLFNGYYTKIGGEGNQLIAEEGNIEPTTTYFNEDGVLYAKWEECGNGNYCSNNIKTPCPSGKVGNGVTTGATENESCDICPVGHYCPGETKKIACPAGTYRATTGGKIVTDCIPCDACYSSEAGAASCYYSSSPALNAWSSTYLMNTSATSTTGTTTIGNLGSSCTNGLQTLEYYTTCSAGPSTSSLDSPKTATITSNQATISINACSGTVLHYRVKDINGNASSWNSVSKFGANLIYGQEYNHFLWARNQSTAAYNSDDHVGYHVLNTTTDVSSRVLNDIGSVAISNNSSATNTEFVEYIYKGILGREADPSGLSSWVSNLNGGGTRNNVLKSFVNSTEALEIYAAWGYPINPATITITDPHSGGRKIFKTDTRLGGSNGVLHKAGIYGLVALNNIREVNVKANVAGTFKIESSNTNKVIVTIPENGEIHGEANTDVSFTLKGVGTRANPLPINITFTPDYGTMYGVATATYYAIAYRWDYQGSPWGMRCQHEPECNNSPCTRCSSNCAGRAVYWYSWNACGTEFTASKAPTSYKVSGNNSAGNCYCLLY